MDHPAEARRPVALADFLSPHKRFAKDPGVNLIRKANGANSSWMVERVSSPVCL